MSWGSKLTISIYVKDCDCCPTDKLALMAAKGAERELRETYDPDIHFVGASVEEVAEKPTGQEES